MHELTFLAEFAPQQGAVTGAEHAEEEVRAALIQLATEAPVGRDVELEERVAGRQGDLLTTTGTPSSQASVTSGSIGTRNAAASGTRAYSRTESSRVFPKG